jgi:exosortase
MYPALLRAPQSITLPHTLPSRAAVVVCLLLVVLAVPTLFQLVNAWQRHPDYDYAWFLAPVVGWLFWRTKPWAYAEAPVTDAGLMSLLVGGLLHLIAQVITWPLFAFAAWVLLGRGLILMVWGRPALRQAMPVLLFTFFLFPLPLVWLNTIALWMQDAISQLATGVLSLVWVCHRQGNVIYMAGLDTPLSVAAACSGVRQLLIFAAAGSFLALFLTSPWRRLLMITAALPVAVLANLLRVLTLAILARSIGPDAIQGSLHDAPLLFTIPLGGFCLWCVFCQLQTAPVSLPTAIPKQTLFYGTPCVALAIIVVLQIGLLIHLHSASGSTSAMPIIDLNALPMSLGKWQGQPHPEAAEVAAQADFADATLTRVYSTKRHAVALYLVHSRTGRDREHHPEICLRDASGARELPQGRRDVSFEGGTALRFAYQRQGSKRTTVYYWHYTVIPPRERLSFLQSLYLRQHERLPSVSVQVQVNLTDPHVWQTIETTFLSEVDREMRRLLPPNIQLGYDRLPIRMTVE